MLLLQLHFLYPVIYNRGKTIVFKTIFLFLVFIICFKKDSCIYRNQSQITEGEKKSIVDIPQWDYVVSKNKCIQCIMKQGKEYLCFLSTIFFSFFGGLFTILMVK